MSKLREKLEESHHHGSYPMAFANMVVRLEDLTSEVERLGGEIATAISQDIMKYTGKGTIQVKILNLKGDLQKVTKKTEEILKASRKLK
jgi:hypothetical protein